MKQYVIESLYEAKEDKTEKLDLANTDVTKEPEKVKKAKPKKEDQQEVERDIINKFCHKYITLGKIKPAQTDKSHFKFHVALKDNVSFWTVIGFSINPKDKTFLINSAFVKITKYKDTKKIAEISQIIKDEKLIKILISVVERFYPKPEKKDAKQEFLGESQKKILNEGYVDSIAPQDVKPGMIGKNYYDEDVEVIAIVPFKDWKKVVKYDDSGWLGGRDMYELIDESDYLIAVHDSDNENSVYVYGPDGVEVKINSNESLKENKNLNELDNFDEDIIICKTEIIVNNDNNVSTDTIYPDEKFYVLWYEDNYFGDEGGYGICSIDDDPTDPNDVWTISKEELDNNFKYLNTNESMNESATEAEQFARDMYFMESKLEKQNSALWEKFEKETGEFWREIDVEDWLNAFAQDVMACMAFKERLQSYLKMNENEDPSLDYNKILLELCKKVIKQDLIGIRPTNKKDAESIVNEVANFQLQ
jgi:hypothetical protein